MNHQMICHRWAQADKTLSLKGFNIFARGLTIYSYGEHFPIATWSSDPENTCVFFNASGYSVSTAKHKTFVNRAIPRETTVFTLPAKLWPISLYTGELQANKLPDALAWYEAQAVEYYAKAGRARVNADWLNSQADGFLGEAAQLAMLFDVPYTRPDLAELRAKAVARAAESADLLRLARAAQAERDAARRAEEAKRNAAWLEGADDRHRARHVYFDDGEGNALVRRSPDGERLETSQGADCPWEQALLIFRKVKQCRDNEKSWHRNGETMRAGAFQIDSIDTGGNMKAGCHNFTWEAMSALAISEGVF